MVKTFSILKKCSFAIVTLATWIAFYSNVYAQAQTPYGPHNPLPSGFVAKSVNVDYIIVSAVLYLIGLILILVSGILIRKNESVISKSCKQSAK